MQYLIGISRNIQVGIQDKDQLPITENSEIIAAPMIEMVLTTYSKTMKFVDDSVIPTKEIQTHRIILNIGTAETLIQDLQNWVTETKIIQNRIKESELTCES